MPDNAKRRLKNLSVEFISLVDAGANRREVVYKNAAPNPNGSPVAKTIQVRKLDEEKQLVYGIVYAPDETDTHGDTMTSPEIEKAAHGFLGAGKTNRVDKQHDGNPDKGLVVESYIIGKNDARFPADPEGAWAVVIKVIDTETWKEVKDGDLKGISMEGFAEAEEIEKSAGDVAREFFTQIGKFMSGQSAERKAQVDEIDDGNLPAFGSFDQALKHYQDNPSLIQKDFNNNLAGRMLHVSVSALDQANWSVIHNEFIMDKKSALKTNIDQFLTHLDSLQVSKSEQQPNEKSMATEEEKKKAAAQAEKAAGKQKETKSTEQEEEESEENEVEQLRKQNELLNARIEKLEKTAGGSQAQSGQDDPDKVQKAKGLKFTGH